jgi:hypothetical protein
MDDAKALLELVEKALNDGLGGCVEWAIKEVDRVASQVKRYGLTTAGIRKLAIEHVRNGGKVHQVKEERSDWKIAREYWYKVIIPMQDLFPNGLFVEIVLDEKDDPDLPVVLLVNAHEQL